MGVLFLLESAILGWLIFNFAEQIFIIKNKEIEIYFLQLYKSVDCFIGDFRLWTFRIAER